jgi:peptidoglycan-associated lipoprotein
MIRKSISLIVLLLCLGLILSGCPKKTVVKEEPSVKKAEESAAERERARLEAEGKEREAKEKEAARIREEEAKKERERKEQAQREQAKKELEKSLVSKKTPGIEGEVFESSLLKDIHFDFDKYDIRPEDTKILKESAALLMKHPGVKIQIEGHCDERGTNEYNLALGERRANSAKKYLISIGIPENRLSTISYGEEKPLDPGHNEEAWAKNRRAHFIILSK